MSEQRSFYFPLPPRLSMNEYADLVESSAGEYSRARIARQKDIEERVRKPFRIPNNVSSKRAPPGNRRRSA